MEVEKKAFSDFPQVENHLRMAFKQTGIRGYIEKRLSYLY